MFSLSGSKERVGDDPPKPIDCSAFCDEPIPDHPLKVYPKPTPAAGPLKCVYAENDFCVTASEDEYPYIQVMNLVDAAQSKDEIMCLGWSVGPDGNIPDPSPVLSVNCFIKDPQGGTDLIPNPFSMFRPFFPYEYSPPQGFQNLGNKLTRLKLYPLIPSEQQMKSCKDWIAKDSWFTQDRGVALHGDMGGGDDVYKKGCSVSNWSGLYYRGSFATDKQIWVYYSNYQDACGLAQYMCGANSTGGAFDGKACNINRDIPNQCDASWVGYPVFLNMDGPANTTGVSLGCPAMNDMRKNTSGAWKTDGYPKDLGNNQWVNNMPPDGGQMPCGGPFPGAFFKINYGTTKKGDPSGSCTENSCKGGQGGTCYVDNQTGIATCKCKDDKATGDCSTCVSGYTMDPTTKACVPAKKPQPKTLFGIPETMVYVIGAMIIVILVILIIKKRQPPPAPAGPDPMMLALMANASS